MKTHVSDRNSVGDTRIFIDLHLQASSSLTHQHGHRITSMNGNDILHRRGLYGNNISKLHCTKSPDIRKCNQSSSPMVSNSSVALARLHHYAVMLLLLLLRSQECLLLFRQETLPGPRLKSLLSAFSLRFSSTTDTVWWYRYKLLCHGEYRWWYKG